MSDYAVWWTSQGCCELMIVACPPDDQKGWTTLLAETFSLPGYIASELSSRLGRAGRGRLWIPETIPLEGILWPDKPTSLMASQCGGIVIYARDVESVRHLPGFVTDLEMDFWQDGDR